MRLLKFDLWDVLWFSVVTFFVCCLWPERRFVGVHVYSSIGGTNIVDFWTTSRVYVTEVWETNWVPSYKVWGHMVTNVIP
jgi:hypothetical protein